MRIFISHSSKNDAPAIALKQWLVSIQWSRDEDIFLDLDPGTGIAPGERWQQELEKAANRCEAVLFLLSQAWLDSKWCIDEFHLASKLNKRLFPLLLEPLEYELLPVGLTAHWQIGNLISDSRTCEQFIVDHQRLPGATVVRFPAIGLTALRRGLEKAGLSPDSFSLQIYQTQPPTWRMPYRGLEALEEEDAAVFFGRDAEIARCIDKLRGVREVVSPRLLVILGASGAGKSSFLRAGILPRLKRDDFTWLPFKPIRVARGGAIEGAEGLVIALEEAHHRLGLVKSRARLRNHLVTGQDFVDLLGELRTVAAERAQTNVPPLPILPIDQAEELFLADAGSEAEHLLMLARAGMEADALLVLSTVRTDSYGKLRDSYAFAGLQQETFSLGSVLPGEIGRIIREPAQRYRKELGPSAPIFHNLVVERLQQELEGETDALPLLGFALQRLMRAHQSGGTIGVAELEQTGGVTKAIETAAEDAMIEAGLQDDAAARKQALRAVFVPRLARVDAISKTIQRRVATMADVPTALRPLIEAFVSKRLLVTKGKESGTTIEVAHEALLRRWPSLTALLEEDRDTLLLLDGVLRAAREWQAAPEQSKIEFLVHRGTRLRYAQQLAVRGQDWAKEVSAAAEYLAACQTRDHSEELEREASEKRILIGKQRLFAAAAGRMASERRYDSAMRLALAGEIDADSVKRGVVADPVRYAQLARAAHDGRMVCIIAQLPGAATCVAFSPDDKLLAAGSHDGRARLFDWRSGTQIATLEAHSDWINGIAFLHCGRLVTGGRDKTIRIWDASTGMEVHRAEGVPDQARCVAVSRNEFAAGCSDGSISIWDAETYAPRSVINAHPGAVLGLAFNHDGTRMVSGGEDGTVQMWDLKDQKSQWKEKLHLEAVNSVAFSPDGSSVASASYDHTARVTDALNGREIRVLVGHTEPLRSITFSPDGSCVATSAGDSSARIWRVRTGRELIRLGGHTGWVHSVAFSRDGRQIATGGFDKTVRLWDANLTTEIARPSNPTTDFSSLAISPDGTQLAVRGTSPIRIYDFESEVEAVCLGDNSAGAGRISFSPDGKTILAATDDGVAHVWNVKDGKEIVQLGGRGSRILAAAFNPRGSEVATVGQEGIVRLWDCNTGGEIRQFQFHNDELFDVAFSHDGALLAIASGTGLVRIFGTGTGPETLTIQAHTTPVRRVVFAPDGKKLATAGDEWNARLWDVGSGSKLGEMSNHGDQVYDVCFSHDGWRVATASRDRITRLWDANDCTEIASFSAPEHVHAVAFHPRSLFIAVAGKRGLIRIWDSVFLAALTGERLARAVAAHRIRGAGRLTDEEIAELQKFTEPFEDAMRNVADLVLKRQGYPPTASDEDDEQIKKLYDIWRHHRDKAFALDNKRQH